MQISNSAHQHIIIMIRVKICCISSLEEAKLALHYGASALGLVGHMPSGPGVISDDLIFQIARSMPPAADSFLLTSEQKAQHIIAHHQRVHTSTIQIVDALEEGSYAEIRKAIPAVKLVQVIHVVDESSIDEAQYAAAHVDAILLDSGNPTLQVKELGGTGRTHNWQISRRIVESLDKAVFLAGGLHAGNVQEAIAYVQPFGLDLCSGVRTNGRLDERKLDDFFTQVQNTMIQR